MPRWAGGQNSGEVVFNILKIAIELVKGLLFPVTGFVSFYILVIDRIKQSVVLVYPGLLIPCNYGDNKGFPLVHHPKPDGKVFLISQ